MATTDHKASRVNDEQKQFLSILRQWRAKRTGKGRGWVIFDRYYWRLTEEDRAAIREAM